MGKVHSEHIGYKRGVGCPGKCTLSTLLLQKCSCPWVGVGGVGWVSRKVHSEHIVATKVFMGGWGCPGKGTLSTLLLQKCSCPLGGGGVRESAL